MVAGAVKEAGSSPEDLRLLVQGIVDAELAQTRDDDPTVFRPNPEPQPKSRYDPRQLPPKKIVEPDGKIVEEQR